jgi:sucrose-6-phosphate hydrolase SacC (GH32 family)
MALFLEGNTFGLFTSRDLKSWTSIQEIEIEEGAECPDFFPMALDGDPAQTKWVLTAANGRFLAGSFDGRTFTPETASQRSEWGKNYYAVQTYSDVKDGRRIQFGWMAGSVFEGMPFNQQFSVARELTLRTTPGGIRLYGHPVREIEALHGEVQSWDAQTLSPGTNPLKELEGELYHILAEFDLAENSASEFGLNLRGFDINYNILAHKLSAYRPTDGAQSEVSLLPENGMITLEILVDIGSVEVFANGGLVPMAFFYLPEDDENGLSLYCKDGPLKISSLEVYEMKSIWNIDVE